MPWCISALSIDNRTAGVVKRRELIAIIRLFDMREVNEGLCARIAASGAPNESWRDLVELFGALVEIIVEHKDLHAYVENCEELRRRLIAAAAAPPLTELFHRLYDLTDVFVRRVLLVSDRAHHALRDHRAVLAALRAGNADEAERLRRLTIANIRGAVEPISHLSYEPARCFAHRKDGRFIKDQMICGFPPIGFGGGGQCNPMR